MRNLLISLLTKASDVFIVKGKSGLKTNPRAIEFALNYALGTKKPMELTKEEIDYTAYQVFNYSRPYQYTEGVLEKGEEISFHPYHILTRDNSSGISLLQRYLTDKTLGLVGDFRAEYQVDSIECSDTWDFNSDTSFEFTLQGYYWILWLVGQLVNLFGIDWYLEHLTGDKFSFSVEECDLSFLNRNHEFTTTWSIPWQEMRCHLDKPRIRLLR